MLTQRHTNTEASADAQQERPHTEKAHTQTYLAKLPFMKRCVRSHAKSNADTSKRTRAITHAYKRKTNVQKKNP